MTSGKLIKFDTWQQMSASNPYDLGVNTTEELWPGMKHEILFGGGGPYTIGAITDVDRDNRATIAAVLPPAPLDPTTVPDLAVRMEKTWQETAIAQCP